MHHPPFESGVRWMDAMGLAGASGPRAVLDSHSQVRLIVCGYIHRPFYSVLGGVPVSVAPSTAWQVHLDLAPDAAPHAAFEPAAAFLHVWNGEAFVTHTSYVIPGAKPIPLSGMMGA